MDDVMHQFLGGCGGRAGTEHASGRRAAARRGAARQIAKIIAHQKSGIEYRESETNNRKGKVMRSRNETSFQRWKQQLAKHFPKEVYLLPNNDTLYRCWEAKQTPEQTALLIRQMRKAQS